MNEHEKRYRNSACLCRRPLLTQKAEEQGANIYRCLNCGGWRRIPPADHESANTDDRERIWYEVAILIFIIIATVAVYIADNAISQYAQLLQEVKQR